VFAGALVTACVSRFPGRATVVATAALALLAWGPVAPVGAGAPELHVLDVRRGEAVALRTARGHWVLVNAGARWRGGDAGRATVVPYLAHRGGSVSAFVLTSGADDHAGGAASALHALRPGVYYDAVPVAGGDAYRAALQEARDNGIAWRRALPGDSLVVDDVTLTILRPESSGGAARRRASGRGATVGVRMGRVRLLLLADPDRIALVPVGPRDSESAPAASAMDGLGAAGAPVLRIDRLGGAVFRTDGHSLRLALDGDDWEVPLTPSPVRPPASRVSSPP
jgi:competence protein ComEC